MKQSTSFMKRCLALVMALVLFATSANLGVALKAFAADAVQVTVAEIVANNYDLSAAEKALLESGLLKSDTYEYTVPTDSDGLVSVDTENATITAESKDGWVPTSAVIVYGGNELTVALTDGVGTYDPAVVGNAFSVKVSYVLNTTVNTSVQESLLGAAALLKQGLKNLDDVAAQSGNLFILEQAMPALLDLAANGVETNTVLGKVQLSADGKAAINYLNGQMEANGGIVNLSKMIAEYEASAKTGYMVTSGAAVKEEVATFVAKTSDLVEALTTMGNNVDVFIGMGANIDPALANQIKTLAKSVDTLYTALSIVNDAPWAIEETAALIVADANYAQLDALVAALGESTAVTAKESLHVADVTLQANLAMWNVTVKVVLNTVVNNEIAEYGVKSVVLTLADGATVEEVVAAVAESGIEADALEAWAGVYVEGKFNAAATALDGALSADIDYVITYNPNNYTVSIAGEAAEYPYGYELTLPVHADPTKSYDYKDANGKYYAQGAVVTVEDNMTFTREEGKSYTTGNLFAIIVDNYGTEKIAAILNSGAVKGDEVISYREPSKAELEELVVLDGNTLKVQAYASSYAGLSWAPYSYVVDGVEHLFNGATEVTLSNDFTTVNVFYRLSMTNHTEAEVRAIFDMVAELVEEAEGQKSVMDRLASYKDQMGQLNKNMLNGLIGMIGGYSVSEGGKYSDELVGQMKATINDIIANCCASDGSLKINGIIDGYTDPNNGGLTYYYQNATEIKGQVQYLSEKLEALLGDPQGKDLISTLLTDMNYGDYVAKLDDLNAKMAEIDADLAPVNANIDTSNLAKLTALAKALPMEGSVEVEKCGSPYIEMGPVIRTAERFVSIEVKVDADGNKKTFSITVPKGEALTFAQAQDLQVQIDYFVMMDCGLNMNFYNNNFNQGMDLRNLAGTVMTENLTFSYSWTPKEFVVKIDGEADQIVTVKDLFITLPEHPNAAYGFSYEYTIGDKTAKSGGFTFEKEDLLNLFVDGVLTITRIEINANVEALEKMVANINIEVGFEALTLVEENGAYTGIEANIAAGDLMNLMMGLVMKSGYSYIGLNGEGFIYSTENGLELSMQTLINAILNDEDFSNDTVIALGENGKGKVMTASMQLGNSATELGYSDLTFTMNLKSVPQQLTNNVGTIKAVSNYIHVYSNNGKLEVAVSLPEQVYGAYAAALIATGNVDKTDAAKLDQAVALQFVYDYIYAITGSEMDLVTFNNTLDMLGINRDITKYNDTYNKVMDAYNEYITVAISETGAAVDVSIPGKQAINALLKLAGIDQGSLSQYLGMLKEYKDGNTIDVSLNGSMDNKGIVALVVDAQASGLTNKFEAPSTAAALAEQTKTLAGYSVIMLMNDVDTNLTISGTTILDLNGFDVNGSINATGKLFIIDSSMDTYNAGSVYAVSGNAVILAGNYQSDVSSYLKDGYYMDGETVRNALYYITDKDNTVTFVLNGDVYEDEHVSSYIPNAEALAIDIASDLLINYALSASLTVEGESLIDIQVKDLVGLYAGDAVNGLIKQALTWVTIGEEGMENQAGFEAVVNMILADVLDFAAISDALENNTALATYEVALAPWTVEIDHITDGNYATVNVGSNAKLTKTFNVALIIESKFNDNLAALTGELAEIVEDETHITIDVPNPSYDNKVITITGAGEAVVSMDMSKNNDYATIIGVVLAYGNPAKAEAVAAAINGNDMDALKTVVDGTSVKEVFTALKKLARNVNFAEMAAKVGVTVDVASAAELEEVYHMVLCGAGKVLEELNITGMDSKLGALYNEETGYYELSKEDIFRDAEFSARGYTALVELTAVELTLKVKLFGEDCLWGDANHDGVVNAKDATWVLRYAVGDIPDGFCTIRTDVNGDGEINAKDATLILQFAVTEITKFPVEE